MLVSKIETEFEHRDKRYFDSNGTNQVDSTAVSIILSRKKNSVRSEAKMSDLTATVLANELIRTALNETIEKMLKTTKYESNVDLASKKGDNFMGIVYRVTCRKTPTNAENTADLKLILKIAPENEQRREGFFSRGCFMREIFLFNEVNYLHRY